MNVSKFYTWAFIVFLIISLILVIHLLFSFVTPVLLAAVIVSIFDPLQNKILKAVGKRDYLAASISTLLVFLGVLIPLAFFMISLVQQAINLWETTEQLTNASDISLRLSSLREYLDVINDHLNRFDISIAPERIMSIASSLSQALGQWLYDGISAVAANLLNLVINFLLTLALVFIFFMSGGSTKRFIMELIPLPDDEKERLAGRFRELSHAIFIGNGLVSVLEGLLGGLSFLAFGISGAIFWGFVITITAFLPLVGAFVVIVPASIYLLFIGKTGAAIALLAFNSLQIIILETLIKPRLIGTKSHMHAALVFMSILGGIQIYGIFGFFYGPLLVTIFLSLVEIYKEHYRDLLLKKRN